MTRFFLACRSCGAARAPGPVDYRCPVCGGELVVRYDESARPLWDGTGVWRYRDRLPLSTADSVVSLGEGGTPLVPVPRDLLGTASVVVKCEHLNPTGSFKDRIATVALSIARERGLGGCVGTSSGNGGAAAAAYAARAGLTAALFALADTAPQKLLQIQALGARVHLVVGLGHDAAATDAAATTIAALAAEHGLMPMLTGGRFSPEAMEGAKTISYVLEEPGQRLDGTGVDHDRFHDERRDLTAVLVERGGQPGRVVERHHDGVGQRAHLTDATRPGTGGIGQHVVQPAVVVPGEPDEPVPAGHGPGQPQGGLYHLRAGHAQPDHLRPPEGGADAFRGLDLQQVRVAVDHALGARLLYRPVDRGVGVPEKAGPLAEQVVDVVIAVGVEQPRALGPVEEDRWRGETDVGVDPAGHVLAGALP